MCVCVYVCACVCVCSIWYALIFQYNLIFFRKEYSMTSNKFIIVFIRGISRIISCLSF